MECEGKYGEKIRHAQVSGNRNRVVNNYTTKEDGISTVEVVRAR